MMHCHHYVLIHTCIYVALISFLREVVAHQDVNKMALHNIATVFGPNLLKREDETIMDKVQDIPFVNEVCIYVCISI